MNDILALGAHVWTASSDKTIKILNAEDGAVLKVLEQHAGFVRCLGLVGRNVWSSGSDKLINVWGSKSVLLHLQNKLTAGEDYARSLEDKLDDERVEHRDGMEALEGSHREALMQRDARHTEVRIPPDTRHTEPTRNPDGSQTEPGWNQHGTKTEPP